MTLTERIDRVLALDDERYSGGWHFDGKDVRNEWHIICSNSCNTCGSDKGNYAFIAAAPEMIAIIREQCTENERLSAELERLRFYAVHKPSCEHNKKRQQPITHCTCGLEMMGR